MSNSPAVKRYSGSVSPSAPFSAGSPIVGVISQFIDCGSSVCTASTTHAREMAPKRDVPMLDSKLVMLYGYDGVSLPAPSSTTASPDTTAGAAKTASSTSNRDGLMRAGAEVRTMRSTYGHMRYHVS
jgi:hypothetical protein